MPAFTLPKLLCWPYLVLLVIALVLPSDGNHGILSPKSLFFLLSLAGCSALFLLYRTFSRELLKLVSFFFFSLAFLLCWVLIGKINAVYDSDSQSDQLKLFLITTTVPVMGIFLVREKFLSAQTIFKTIFFGNFFYCFAKLVLAIASALGFISIWDVMQILGIRFMQMGIYGGLERVQTSVDIITPFVVLFVLQSAKLKIKLPKGFISTYTAVACLANFLSFSRLLLFVFCASVLFFVMTLPMKNLLRWFLVIITALTGAAFYFGLDPITQVIEKRLYSDDNYLSDSVRHEQVNFLLQEYQVRPWFGKGMGSYVEGFVRDYQLPHSYEVQWAAFLMQFGFIGLLGLIVPLVIILWHLLAKGMTGTRLGFAALFCIWIFSGFTNPYLISLTSGLVYTLFFLAGDLLPKPLNLQVINYKKLILPLKKIN